MQSLLRRHNCLRALPNVCLSYELAASRRAPNGPKCALGFAAAHISFHPHTAFACIARDVRLRRPQNCVELRT